MTGLRGRKFNAPLSSRQDLILLLLADGDTREEVGKKLGVEPGTISATMRVIRAKLGAKTTAHAVAIAYQKGILK